jgi:hypothetical protein
LGESESKSYAILKKVLREYGFYSFTNPNNPKFVPFYLKDVFQGLNGASKEDPLKSFSVTKAAQQYSY